MIPTNGITKRIKRNEARNRDNYMIMATDREIEPDDRLNYHVSRFDRILTDSLSDPTEDNQNTIHIGER